MGKENHLPFDACHPLEMKQRYQGVKADLARVTAERDESRLLVAEWVALVADLREALRARGEQSVLLAEALKFYADPETYEQVDILGICQLSDDKSDDGVPGERARRALG